LHLLAFRHGSPPDDIIFKGDIQYVYWILLTLINGVIFKDAYFAVVLQHWR
jgi:hypothetical protein